MISLQGRTPKHKDDQKVLRVDLEGRMTRRRAEGGELQEQYAAATSKIRMWRNRADLARLAGRKADASRCEDKVRDWASRAKQIEQQLADEGVRDGLATRT
jgi:hypothetical protein